MEDYLQNGNTKHKINREIRWVGYEFKNTKISPNNFRIHIIYYLNNHLWNLVGVFKC